VWKSACLGTVLLASFTAVPAAEPQKLAIRFGTLIDGTGRVQKDAVVLIVKDRIQSVQSGHEGIAADATVVDLSRYTGLPGLIDAHTHMTYALDPTIKKDPWAQQSGDRYPAVAVFLSQENARRCLETGVTTVRDLGADAYNDIALRDLINRGAIVGPRMFVAGHGLYSTYAPAKPTSEAPYPGLADGTAAVLRVVRQEIRGHDRDRKRPGRAADLHVRRDQGRRRSRS
jgi:imidazolonepropionase-like amidohydrolase